MRLYWQDNRLNVSNCTANNIVNNDKNKLGWKCHTRNLSSVKFGVNFSRLNKEAVI